MKEKKTKYVFFCEIDDEYTPIYEVKQQDLPTQRGFEDMIVLIDHTYPDADHFAIEKWVGEEVKGILFTTDQSQKTIGG